MANAWLAHVKKTMRAHKGQKFSAILKLAKKSYKKHRGGASPVASVESSDSAADKKGADPVVPDPEADDAAKMPGGRRRRRSSRRTRRHRRR